MANTAEVTNLTCSKTNLLSWGVSSTSYLKGFEVVEEVNGVAVQHAELASTVFSWQVPSLTNPATIVVRAIVLQGGKSIIVAPLAKPEPPIEPPVVGFSPGINTGLEAEDLAVVTEIGAKLARVEVAYANLGEAPHVIETLAAKGVRAQLLVSADGGMPSASQVAALGPLAEKYGPKSSFSLPILAVEHMNETSYEYMSGSVTSSGYKEIARTYAIRAKEASEALAPHGVGLLVQASDGGANSSVWVNEIFASVPELTKYVAGWTIHPYSGQQVASQADSFGVPMLERMIAGLAAHGDTTTPIDVTEWGFTSNNGGTLSDGKHYTYAEAATMAEAHLAKLKVAAKAHPLHSFMVYQDRDQKAVGATTNRECYFGVRQHEGQQKGAYTTTIEALLRS